MPEGVVPDALLLARLLRLTMILLLVGKTVHADPKCSRQEVAPNHSETRSKPRIRIVTPISYTASQDIELFGDGSHCFSR